MNSSTSWRCWRSTPRATSPAWMLRRTVSHGNRLGSWNISPRSALGPVIGSRPTRSSPEVGWSSPAISRSSVDLPQPLGPISDTISPAATVSDSRLRASTAAPSAARNVLLTSRTRSAEPSATADGRRRCAHHLITPFCHFSTRSRTLNSSVMRVEKNTAMMSRAAYTLAYSA